MATGKNTLTVNIDGTTAGLDRAVNKAVGELDKLGDSAEKVNKNTEKLPDIDKKLTFSNMMQASETLSGVGDKLIDLGTNAIQSAGNALAMEAQFQQVFGNMSSEAQGTIDKMATSFGMLPNRIKPLYTTLTSMFKGLGMSQAEAMKEAEIATNIAADAAAFYDMSLEDAASAMTSFVKGNYEGGESIGLFANDTQMAAFAAKNDLIPALDGAKEISEELEVASLKASKKYAEMVNKHGESSIEARDALLKLNDVRDKIDAELGPQAQKWADLDEATKQAVRVEYAKQMQEQSGAMGQAAREADGLENQMGNAKQALQDFYAQLGKDMLPTFIKVLQGGVDMLSKLGNAWSKLDSPMKNFILVFGGLIALFTTLAPLITAVIAVAGALGTTFLPIIAIIAGVAAVIAIVIEAFKNWDKITEWFSNTWKSFTSWLNGSWDGIKEGASNIWEGVKEKWSGFVEGVKGIWSGVKDWFSNLWTGLTDGALNIWEGVKDTWSTFVDWVKGIWDGVKAVWAIVWADIVGIVKIPWTIMTALIQTGINIIKAIFDVAGQLLSAAWQAVWTPIQTFLTNTWNTITTFISNTWNSIVSIANSIFTPLANFFSSVWTTIQSVATSVWNTIVSTLSSIWNSITSVATSVFNTIANVISTVWNKISSVTSSVWNTITSVVSGIWNRLTSMASNVWNTMTNVINSAVNAARSVVTSVWNSISSFVSNIWNRIKSVASSVWNGITSTITNQVNNAKNGISSGWSSLTGIVSNIFNNVKNTIGRVWDGVVDTVMKPVNKAREIVGNMFKGLKIEIPHIPLPHFSLKGSFNPLKGQIPSLNVEWHAKGGIFSKPTLLGDGSHGVGEAGREAVIPLKPSVLRTIGNEIFQASTVPNQGNTQINNISLNINVEGNADENTMNNSGRNIIDAITRIQNQNDMAWT